MIYKVSRKTLFFSLFCLFVLLTLSSYCQNKFETTLDKIIYLIIFFSDFSGYSTLYCLQIKITLPLTCQPTITITGIHWLLCNISTALITLSMITPTMYFALCKELSKALPEAQFLAVLKTWLNPRLLILESVESVHVNPPA